MPWKWIFIFAFSLNVEALSLSSPTFRQCGSSFRHQLAVHLLHDDECMKLTTSDTVHFEREVVRVELEKPLGMVLTEVDENAAKGVRVEKILESGSASVCLYKDKILGLKLSSVMGEDVSEMYFDDVMAKIIDATSPVALEFVAVDFVPSAAPASPTVPEESNTAQSEDEIDGAAYEIGTPITINVIQDGKGETSIDAKVGDNLRKLLLANEVELYRGLKKKLGNCGGVGQCTFCAVDFVQCDGWAERSEYEERKIGKWPNARLACMNNIQGPATIRLK